jgi:thiaminase/transcriptional activator TenA
LIETAAILDSLHGRAAAAGGLAAAEFAATRPAFVTYAFTRHLLSVALDDSYLALIAALLPAMWMYDELGHHLAARGTPPADHPYHAWLVVHAEPHLDTITRWMRDILDSAAPDLSPAARAHLAEVFLLTSRFEILFWDMAWREEDWPSE